MTNPLLQFGKSENKTINLGILKGGIKKSDIDSKFHPLFDLYDDGNGVLTDDEIQNIKSAIEQAANPNNKINKQASIFSDKEQLGYLNSNVKLKDIDTETLYDFLKFIETSSQKVISSNVVDDTGIVATKLQNGNGEIIENYDTNTQILEKVVNTNSSVLKTYLKNDKKFKEVEIDNNTGDITTTNFDEDGINILTKVVETQNPKKVVTIKYKNNEPETENIVSGDVEEIYEYVNQKKRLIKKSDKNSSTSILYNENGRIENTQTGETNMITEYDTLGNEIKRTTVSGKFKRVKTTDNNTGRVAIKKYMNDKKMSEDVEIMGHKYVVQYDGQGNTKGVVVQNEEVIQQIAEHFKCSKQALINANRHIILGTHPNEYFKAGANIVIPREIEADEFSILNRGRHSSKTVKSEFEQGAIQRAEKRIQEKPTKDIVLSKNYSNWEEFTIELLKQQNNNLNYKPTQNEINILRNELVALNLGVAVPKKGENIKILKTRAEIENENVKLSQFEQDIVKKYLKELSNDEKIKFTNLPPKKQYELAKNFMEQLINNEWKDKVASRDTTKAQSPSMNIARAEVKASKISDNFHLRKTAPQKIANKYKNESSDVKAIKQRFINTFIEEINSAINLYNEHKENSGLSEKTADWIAHLWNNKISDNLGLSTGNVSERIEDKIKFLKDIVLEFQFMDNSAEGVARAVEPTASRFKIVNGTYKVLGIDFDSIYKKISGGKDFDADKMKKYLDEREHFMTVASVVSQRDLIHSRIDEAFNNYYKNSANVDVSSFTKAAYASVSAEQQQKHSEERLIMAMKDILNLSDNDVKVLKNKCKENNLDFVDELKKQAEKIKTNSNKIVELVAGKQNVDLKSMKKHLNMTRSEVLNESIIDTVDNYNLSQEIGGSVVSGVFQMAVSALCMNLGGVSATLMKTLLFATLGFADRTNEVFKDGHLNADTVIDIFKNAGVDVFANWLIEAPVVKKYVKGLGNNFYEKVKKVYNQNSSAYAKQVGLNVLSDEGKEFSSKTINKMLKTLKYPLKEGTKDTVEESVHALNDSTSLSEVETKFVFGFVTAALFHFKRHVRFKSINDMIKSIGVSEYNLSNNTKPQNYEDLYNTVKPYIVELAQQSGRTDIIDLIDKHDADIAIILKKACDVFLTNTDSNSINC